ncbi:MAG: AraC family transcriptional regulator, partial [Gammaproteobacteria bacterium]|nr:AraC family transcriptional regulator [Gammaproteobacteria bacterium]
MALLQLARQILGAQSGATVRQLGIAEAVLLQRTAASAIEGTLYRPLMCLILQGAKTVSSGDITVQCKAGHSIIVSHDLPVLSKITQASINEPYIALVIPLDLSILRSFYDELAHEQVAQLPVRAMATHGPNSDLLDCALRLLRLSTQPSAVPLLGPLLTREIHARLLLSVQGASLRRFLSRDDPSTQLAHAIRSIKSSLQNPLSITELSQMVGMSKSAFHAHFKAVIGLSPGQY